MILKEYMFLKMPQAILVIRFSKWNGRCWAISDTTSIPTPYKTHYK